MGWSGLFENFGGAWQAADRALQDAGGWFVDDLAKTDDRVNGFLFGGGDTPKTPKAPEPYVGTQENSPYVMLNNKQLANQRAGRGPNDNGPQFQFPEGNNGNGGGAAAAVAAMLKSIEESYNRQVQGLDKNKATANTGIQNAYSQFRTNTDANNNVYQQGANQISADVSNRAAQSMQQAQQANQQIQQSVGGLGGDIGALRAQAQGNELALQGSNNAQQDLTARIAQIVAANHSSTQGSGDLVRQGAVGNLENNYTGMLNALMSSKEQQIAQANQSAYSGGGSGGSSSSEISYQDALKERLAQRMFMDYDSGNDPDQATLMYQMALNDPAAFATAFFGQQTAP